MGQFYIKLVAQTYFIVPLVISHLSVTVVTQRQYKVILETVKYSKLAVTG